MRLNRGVKSPPTGSGMPWVAGDEADGPLDHFNTVRSFAKWPSVPKDMIEHAISQVTKMYGDFSAQRERPRERCRTSRPRLHVALLRS